MEKNLAGIPGSKDADNEAGTENHGEIDWNVFSFYKYFYFRLIVIITSENLMLCSKADFFFIFDQNIRHILKVIKRINVCYVFSQKFYKINMKFNLF